MINFKIELGYPLTWKIEAKFHRYKIKKKCQGYNKYTLIPIKYCKQIINFNDICKNCLNTFNVEEIENLKQYLVLRKLKS